MSIAVVLPNHNYANFVCSAIESIFKQSVLPARLFIVDDGSTDNSLDMITSITGCQWDTNEDTGVARLNGGCAGFRVDAVHFPKARGPSFARNYALGMLAKDKSIQAYAFLDSDDIYDMHFIKKTAERMFSDIEHIGVVYTDSYTLYTKDGVAIPRYWEPFEYDKLVEGNRLAMNSLVNRKAIDAVGTFDQELRTLEDWDLWLRISEKFILVHLPEFLFTQRNHGQNTTDTVNQEKWLENRKKVLHKLYIRVNYGQ